MSYATATGFRHYGLRPIYNPTNDNIRYFYDFPLVSAKVHYRVVDVQYLATLTQTYTSLVPLPTPIEVQYTFPLPPDASVCSYKAVIDRTRTITGVVRSKMEARRDYDEAVNQGKTASLLEQVNVEVFQVSLGNIGPGQTVEVQITFAALISQDPTFDSLRLTFPTAIAPRYGLPPTSSSSNTNRNGSPLPPQTLELTVTIEMASYINSITSPSHPISIHLGSLNPSSTDPDTDTPDGAEFDPKKAFVSLLNNALLDKDMVLVLKCKDLDRPRCTVESFAPEEHAGKAKAKAKAKGEGVGEDDDKDEDEYTDAYSFTVVPRFDLPALPRQEYIFLVDRSGSMRGGKMTAVRGALQIMLKSLPSHSTLFNIFSFGSGYSSLWTSSRPYTADSVEEAVGCVEGMQANFGGTAISTAVVAAINSKNTAWMQEGQGREPIPTAIFVLTDGQAWDLDGVFAFVRGAVADAKRNGSGLLRVFTLGIGNAVSKEMCDGIARAGQGTSVFVGETEKPDHKLMGLLRAARGAPIEDLSVDWGVGVGEDDTMESDDFELVSSIDIPDKPSTSTSTQLPPLSLFDSSYTPALADASADLGPKPIVLPPPPRIQEAPSLDTLPSLYPGFRTSLFAIVKRTNSGNSPPSKVVTLKGTVLGRPVQLEVPVVPATIAQVDSEIGTGTGTPIKILHVLAARALIRKFEDHKPMTELDTAEVLRLAKRYSLASSQTSFVAIDEDGRSVAINEDGRSVDTANIMEPSEATKRKRGKAPLARKDMSSAEATMANLQFNSYQHLIGGVASSTNLPGMGSMTLSSSATSGSTAGEGFSSGAAFGGESLRRKRETDKERERDREPAIKRRRGRPRKAEAETEVEADSHMRFTDYRPTTSATILESSLETFARLQSFDGSFARAPGLFELIVQGDTAPQMSPILAGLQCNDEVKESVWRTLLCVMYLEAKFSQDRDVWDVMAEKALDYVTNVLQGHTEDVAGSVSRVKEKAAGYIVV